MTYKIPKKQSDAIRLLIKMAMKHNKHDVWGNGSRQAYLMAAKHIAQKYRQPKNK